MKMKIFNDYFLGILPYENFKTKETTLPMREDETKRLKYMLENEKVSILSSQAKLGKTSLINAVFSKMENTSSDVCALRFEIPPFKFGDKVLEKQLVSFLSLKCTKPTYVDMAFEDDNSLWYVSKKLQACYQDKKRFCLVLDSFENFFTYTSSSRKEFAKALAGLIYGEVPQKYNAEIQKIMLGESDTPLSKDSMKLLCDSLNISLLFSIEDDSYNSLAELEEDIHGIFQNTLKLLPFDFKTAENAVEIIATEPFEDLKPIKFDEKAVELLVKNISFNSLVNPGFLRSAVLFFRKNFSEETVINQEIIEKSGYFETSRLENFLSTIQDEELKHNFLNFLVSEMVFKEQTQPLPVLETKALTEYALTLDLLDKSLKYCILKKIVFNISHNFYLPYNAVIFRSIVLEKQKLPDFKPIVSPLKTVVSDAKTDSKVKKRTIRNRTLVVMCFSVCLICVAFVLLAFSLKGDAERSANMARSNMLTAFAFQKLENDPTFSLRLAQKAVSLDTTNIQAYSALLNSFYNTDIFYNISGEIADNVVKAEISSDGQYVMTFVKNDNLEKYCARILNVNGDVITEIPHKKEVTSICISKDNSLIMTTSYDSTARVFDFSGKELLSIMGHNSILWTCDISSDNSMFLTGGADCKVKVWDLSGKCISTLSGHDFDVYCAKFSPDNSLILTSGGDNTARLWTKEGVLKKIFEINEDNRFSMSIIVSAVFSNDGQYVLTASNDYLNRNHRARLFDLSGKELVNFSGHENWINSANFSPDSKHVITSSRDKTVRIFNINGSLEKVLKGHNSNVWSAVFMPNNNSVVTAGDDHTIRSWTPGKRFETYQNAKNISFACFSGDGLHIAVVQDTNAMSWDLTGGTSAVFSGHTQNVNTARFSSDGKMLLTSSNDATVRLWEAATGKNLKVFSDNKLSKINDAVFSNDNKFLVYVGDSSIVIRDLETDLEHHVENVSSEVLSVCFHPSGKSFVTGFADGKIVLYDLLGKVLRTFHGHDGRVNSVSFSPSGEYIISTSSDETAVLWDNLGQMRFTFRGYENKVNSAVFSPDSKFVLTTSDDGFARLWTIDGKEVVNFKHDGKVSSAVFSPDGNYILSVYNSNDGIKTMKLRMISPDGITRHIDMLDLYGDVWKPDSKTLKKYGMD